MIQTGDKFVKIPHRVYGDYGVYREVEVISIAGKQHKKRIQYSITINYFDHPRDDYKETYWIDYSEFDARIKSGKMIKM